MKIIEYIRNEQVGGPYGNITSLFHGKTQHGCHANQKKSLDANVSSLSELENAILRSLSPVKINETEEININGIRGILANKSELLTWKGVVPIEQYSLNKDSDPEIITKIKVNKLEYFQELAIRYLRPPSPPAPGEIIIQQRKNKIIPAAPPLVIRQVPARPLTPEPLVMREVPPQQPTLIGRKFIQISGKRLPPPPRKVVIERVAPLPSKPQSVIIERWIPYQPTKRRVIFQKSNQVDPVVVKPRNVIVQWDTPNVVVKKEFKYLGIIRVNPAEYVFRFRPALKMAKDLPQIALDIQTPQGLVLAADCEYNSHYELEGDLKALNLVNLEAAGLSEYKSYLERLGIVGAKSNKLANNISNKYLSFVKN